MNVRPLPVIEAEIRQCIEALQLHIIQIALAIDESRRHFPHALAWLAWCEENFEFARRHSYDYGRLGDWLRLLDHDAREAVRRVALPVGKLFVLSRVPAAQVPEFLRLYNPAAIRRDELRVAVREFLGDRPSPRFLPYARLPEPEQLLLGLDDPEESLKIDYDREYRYIESHLTRIVHVLPRLDPDQVDALADELAATSERLRYHARRPKS